MKHIFTAACLALGCTVLTAPTPAQAQADDAMLGAMMTVGFNFCPRGWALADGQLLPIQQNQSLYSLLGTTYGGDGRTTFALPDLRGRRQVGRGNGPGLTPTSWGERGGAEQLTLTQNNLPAHSHEPDLKATSGAADSSSPAGALLAAANIYTAFGSPDAPLASSSAGDARAGNSQPFSLMMPYLTMNTCIALQGIFPSRN